MRRKAKADTAPDSDRRPTQRARGKVLLADLADLHRQESRLLREASDVFLRMSAVASQKAQKVLEIGAADVELPTGRKRREPPAPPVIAVDDLSRQAALAVGKVIP